ncbi:aromatic amino acid DMT transporter YddG [Carnimonas bestiolae]|uniref:aromatic amino acid DMT transporter YddG n=1 Tax=Carnimonas bestiolae TaxID=3402172 RepID=UPI003EDC7C40
MNQSARYTAIGLCAVLLWALLVGLFKRVADEWGAVGGAALVYTVASVLLWIIAKPPALGRFPRRYLIVGCVLFVCYELCLSLSIGYANNSREAIEVGMINYLWPAVTMVMAVVFNKQRASLLMVPGIALALLGVFQVLEGDHGLSLTTLLDHLQTNPTSYLLALMGVFIWSAYCTITVRMSRGANGITLFFSATAVVLWLGFLAGNTGFDAVTVQGVGYLLAAGAALGFGYGAWNLGMLRGNITLLAGASYFIPVLSALLAALMLGASLTAAFWQGAGLVVLGSILCWVSTRQGQRRKAKQSEAAHEHTTTASEGDH